jgi:hypothetical protein
MTRKRSSRGGRHPQTLSKSGSPLSLRMTPALRDKLEAAASAKDKNLSQEILWRLEGSFGKERDKANDPELRALCFLVAKLTRDVVGFWDVEGRPLSNWRSDPFFFRAFKIAVAELLDALDPGGEAVPPTVNVAASGTSRLSPEFFSSFESPQERGRYAAKIRLALLREAGPSPDLNWLKTLDHGIWTQVADELYGLSDARQALENKTREKTP